MTGRAQLGRERWAELLARFFSGRAKHFSIYLSVDFPVPAALGLVAEGDIHVATLWLNTVPLPYLFVCPGSPATGQMDAAPENEAARRGYAMLLGPNFSIVLTELKTQIGRASKNPPHARQLHESPNKSSSLSASSSHAASSSHSRNTVPLSASSSNSSIIKSNTELAATSPLYWRREWAKLQRKTADNTSSSNVHPDSASHPSTATPYADTQNTSLMSGQNESSMSVDDQGVRSSTPLATNLDHALSTLISGPTSDAQHSNLPSAPVDTDPHLNGSPEEIRSAVKQVDVDLGPDPLVSRLHATITYDPELALWDITSHSKNGLFLNGRMIYAHDGPAVLHSKSRVQIGAVPFFFLLPYTPPSRPHPSDSTPLYLRSNETCKDLIMLESEYTPAAPAAPSIQTKAVEEAPSESKKRKQDRSIVPLTPLKLLDEPAPKRKYFGTHVSQRAHSYRSLLEYSNEDSEEFLGLLNADDPKASHLNAKFNPRLEAYTEQERRARYAPIVPQARQTLVESAPSATTFSPPPAKRGPRERNDTGYDASGAAIERPKYTYGQLIQMALEATPDKRLVFADICDWVLRAFPFFGTPEAGNFQNSLRQALKTTVFVRHERPNATGRGKGGYWALARWYEHDRLLPRPRN